MDYSKMDFSKMIFNVYDVEDNVDLLDRFPRLNAYEEFASYSKRDRDKLFRFIFYAYDKNSPLMDYRIQRERLFHAFELSEITPKHREKILSGGVPELDSMVRVFLSKIINNRKFELYISMCAALDDLLDIISKPIEKGEKDDPKKLQDANKVRYTNSTNAKDLINDIEKLEEELFPHFDEVRGLLLNDKEASVFQAGAAEGSSDLMSKLNG
jgi:hypothetical protein